MFKNLLRLFSSKPSSRTDSGSPVSQDLAVMLLGPFVEDDIKNLKSNLAVALANANNGIVDGDDTMIDCTKSAIYLKGPSSDSMFETIRPILEKSKFSGRGSCSIWYGKPGAAGTTKRDENF